MNTVTVDLAGWLLQQIAEDEQIAREAAATAGDGDTPVHEVFGGFGRRMLAECAAKRRIVELHRPMPVAGGAYCIVCEAKVGGVPDYPCDTLRILAEPYADCPDYIEEWRL